MPVYAGPCAMALTTDLLQDTCHQRHLLMYQCFRDGLFQAKPGLVKKADAACVRSARHTLVPVRRSIDPVSQNVVNEAGDLRVLG